MIGGMIPATENFQVPDGIILFVAVDMMDDLVTPQFPAKVRFHDVPMFKHTLPVYGDFPVALSGNSPFSVGTFFTEEGIAVADQSQVVGIAHPTTSDWILAIFNDAEIGRIMLDKSSCRILFHSVHDLSSLLDSMPQTTTEGKRNDGANGVNSGKPERIMPRAILSQAGDTSPEGAETTGGVQSP